MIKAPPCECCGYAFDKSERKSRCPAEIVVCEDCLEFCDCDNCDKYEDAQEDAEDE